MPRLKFLVLLAGVVCFALPHAVAQKKPKPPEVEVLDLAVHRNVDVIAVDARVKNVSAKPIRKMKITLDFIAADGRVMTTKSGELDHDELAVGEEGAFHFQLEDSPKAAFYRFRLEDGAGRDLRADSAEEKRPIE
jgi:hypothetical protein